MVWVFGKALRPHRRVLAPGRPVLLDDLILSLLPDQVVVCLLVQSEQHQPACRRIETVYETPFPDKPSTWDHDARLKSPDQVHQTAFIPVVRKRGRGDEGGLVDNQDVVVRVDDLNPCRLLHRV